MQLVEFRLESMPERAFAEFVACAVESYRRMLLSVCMPQTSV